VKGEEREGKKRRLDLPPAHSSFPSLFAVLGQGKMGKKGEDVLVDLSFILFFLSRKDVG